MNKREEMKSYTGTKTVLATPMTRKEYVTYRGWEMPANEDPNEPVYLVEYAVEPDTVPNHPDHLGYITMSPATVFEKYYKGQDSFYDRLLVETQELAEKTNKLNDFMRTTNFVKLDRENKDLLYIQSRLMNEYVQVLGRRLEILGGEFKFKK